MILDYVLPDFYFILVSVKPVKAKTRLSVDHACITSSLPAVAQLGRNIVFIQSGVQQYWRISRLTLLLGSGLINELPCDATT